MRPFYVLINRDTGFFYPIRGSDWIDMQNGRMEDHFKSFFLRKKQIRFVKRSYRSLHLRMSR